MKDKPLKSQESVRLQWNRKNMLHAMSKAINAREKNKYLSSKQVASNSNNPMSASYAA